MDKQKPMSKQDGSAMATTGDLNNELDSFRQQWLSDLRSGKTAAPEPERAASGATLPNFPPSRPSDSEPGVNAKIASTRDDDDGYTTTRSFDEPLETAHQSVSAQVTPSGEQIRELSAVEHYEQAVEKETQGSLGDSLRLYRAAFKVRALLHWVWIWVRNSCNSSAR